jgi:hypothetical protein
MKLAQPIPNGEHRYAVAFREGSDLWLTLWVKRSPKGEFFVLMPRGNRAWDVHNRLVGEIRWRIFLERFGYGLLQFVSVIGAIAAVIAAVEGWK